MKEKELLENYAENRQKIESRLSDFENLRDAENSRLFQELVFVILSSQTDAKKAWKAAEQLESQKLLLEGNEEEISKILRQNEVQYEDRKASYIVDNRTKLSQPTLEDPSGEIKLKQRIEPKNLDKTRKWLAESIEGVSWKGASHFLRNIGYGNSFAIISSHILKVMSELRLIENSDPPQNKQEYLEYEEKVQQLAENLDIDVKALDLVTWSLRTGEVFK